MSKYKTGISATADKALEELIRWNKEQEAKKRRAAK